MPMQMTEDEIVREFRQARNRDEQVDILAQLNGVSRTRIIGILSDHANDLARFGVKKIPKARRHKKTAYPWTEQQLLEVMRLKERGMRTSEISAETGIAYSVIRNKLKQLSVPSGGKSNNVTQD